MTLKVLVVDDDPIDARKVTRMLSRCEHPYEVVSVDSEEAALSELSRSDYDCVVLDCLLGPEDGIDLLRKVRQAGNDVAVVVHTGFGCEEVAVTAMKENAQDYIAKDSATPESMHKAVANAIEKVALKRQLDDQRRELADFVAMASHDLRNPAVNVLRLAETLEEELSDLSGDSARLLRSIRRSGSRMKSLIDGLLEYTRAGRLAVSLMEVDLNKVLEGVRAELYGVLGDSGARVEVGDLPVIWGEPVALGQLFQNLIANGVKYNESDEPRVSVKAELLEDQEWLVSVSDNGIGMDGHSLSEIFLPLRRLPNSQDYEGCGLGLATTAKIAKQHGGRVWAESAPGEGSTFYITFPVGAEAVCGVT